MIAELLWVGLGFAGLALIASLYGARDEANVFTAMQMIVLWLYLMLKG